MKIYDEKVQEITAKIMSIISKTNPKLTKETQLENAEKNVLNLLREELGLKNFQVVAKYPDPSFFGELLIGYHTIYKEGEKPITDFQIVFGEVGPDDEEEKVKHLTVPEIKWLGKKLLDYITCTCHLTPKQWKKVDMGMGEGDGVYYYYICPCGHIQKKEVKYE